jgi:hypothetical protein
MERAKEMDDNNTERGKRTTVKTCAINMRVQNENKPGGEGHQDSGWVNILCVSMCAQHAYAWKHVCMRARSLAGIFGAWLGSREGERKDGCD